MRVGIVTLGCDKNTVDNEYLAGILAGRGCELSLQGEAGFEEALDAVVVTTCGFIGNAKQQSVEAIMEMAERKRDGGSVGRIYVAGCLSQRYAGELLAEIPEIDGLVGVGQYEQLGAMIGDGLGGIDVQSVNLKPQVDIYQFMQRRRIENTPHAFLKIADGCNHACTFCSIPSMKGKLRSVPPEIVLQEARALLDSGARELNLVAQDLADYGRDRWKDYRLPELLRDLAALDGDFWIRCLYVYPGGINDKFLDVMATEPKIVPYLDMPLQHLERDTLHRMKRPYKDMNTVELVARLRREIPNLTLRTTMIVGFPGETHEAHLHMLDRMRELRFERLGAFMYSREEDTPAGLMPKQIKEAVKQLRHEAVMTVQAQISEEHNRTRIGATCRVLVERYDAEVGQWVGRSVAEAPEIDGCVYFNSDDSVPAGEFVSVQITGADTYDVFGVALPAQAHASNIVCAPV